MPGALVLTALCHSGKSPWELCWSYSLWLESLAFISSVPADADEALEFFDEGQEVDISRAELAKAQKEILDALRGNCAELAIQELGIRFGFNLESISILFGFDVDSISIRLGFDLEIL